jgi:hypothetical protein
MEITPLQRKFLSRKKELKIKEKKEFVQDN